MYSIAKIYIIWYNIGVMENHLYQEDENMTTRENEGKKKTTTLREDRILMIAIVLPIVALLLAAGGPAIWKGISSVFKVIFPNCWVGLVDIYLVLLAFMIGRKSKK